MPYFLFFFCQFSFTSACLLKMCTCILCRCYFTVCTSPWGHSSLIQIIINWLLSRCYGIKQSNHLEISPYNSYTKTGSAISIDFRPENVAVCHIFTSLSNVSVNSKPNHLPLANVRKGEFPTSGHKESAKPHPQGRKFVLKPTARAVIFSNSAIKNSTEWNANMFRNIEKMKHKNKSFLVGGFYEYSKYLKSFSIHL